VRQLKNFAERLVLNCSLRCNPNMLEILFNELIQFSGVGGGSPGTGPPQTPTSLKVHVRANAIQNEKAIILEALQQNRYRISRTAEHLGISRTTLWRKMREMGLDQPANL
jgi:DNA-binding NtrC family response regulator